MVTRPTADTVKSTHILAAALVVLWLADGGYGQDAVPSPCSNNNAGCQHMCSVSKDINGVLAYECVCNKGYQLAEDKHNCVLSDAILLYSQATSIKGKVLNNVSEGYSELILPGRTISNWYSSLDVDTHDNYIYYSDDLEENIIYRIHINGKGKEIVLSSEGECVFDLSIDWVTKNLYYIDIKKGTLNVLSTRNATNKRVLLQNEFMRRLVIHPNKGYIFFSEKGISRVNMDGSNLISFKYQDFYWKKGLTVDFATDRLYWCEQHHSLIYHSNLDLKNVTAIKSEWIQHPRLIAMHKDWMYVINNAGTSLTKLNKLNGYLTKIELQNQDHEDQLHNLKIYSKHEQYIDNTHPCSMAANYGGCEKLCFAVLSNKSIVSSLQALCSCLDGEKVDLDGKTCVVESKAEIDSIAVVDSNAVVVSVSGGASRHMQYRYVTTVCFVLVYLFNI